ncbi:Alpha/Beta hydrolase protein [Aspergillus granulosus]|uniref:Alpha/Beta hydrolase protein n=1 Tax=Aspergillus granulosus TaxID=176169 RepID=A0ABR4HSC2_9EURO
MSSGFAKNGLYWCSEAPLRPSQPTILFIHASWMSSSMWGETTQSLASHFPDTNLVRVDLNGHGKTAGGREEYTLWDQAQDVLTLIDELNFSNVLVAAISMGTMVALRMALLSQTKLSGLILLSANASAASEAHKIGFPQLRDIWTSTPSPSDAIMNGAILAWGGATDIDCPRAQRIRDDWVQRHSGKENIDPTLRSMMERESLLGRLAEIRVPVLLVHGEDDRTYPVQDAVAIQRGLVNAAGVTLEVLKGEGHILVYLRDSEDVTSLIRGFATKVGSQPTCLDLAILGLPPVNIEVSGAVAGGALKREATLKYIEGFEGRLLVAGLVGLDRASSACYCSPGSGRGPEWTKSGINEAPLLAGPLIKPRREAL